MSEDAAQNAINAGFETIEKIHKLMSFHEAESDLTALNTTAHQRPVSVHAYTYAVLESALAFARDSKGVFDPTVGYDLVKAGVLPRPNSMQEPDTSACWRDVELLPERYVRFHKPLWIDLGGIAKGFAVDKAVESLAAPPEVQLCVNAGGDLRVSGPAAELVRLDARIGDAEIPVLKIENGSIASSSGYARGGQAEPQQAAAHLHGVRRTAVGERSFVSVLAEDCLSADALTKIVLALGPQADAFLWRCGATALLHNARDGWRTLGLGND